MSNDPSGGEIRFGVRVGDRMSSTFKVWANPGSSDFYMVTRSLGGVLKVSFHPSKWRVAFTTEYMESRGADWLPQRLIVEWPPPPGDQQLVKALTALVPTAGVLLSGDFTDKRVTWVEATTPATWFPIILNRGDEPAKVRPAGRIIGQIALADGAGVGVIYAPMPGVPQLTNPQLLDTGKRWVVPPEESKAMVEAQPTRVRGWVFGRFDDDGSRFVMDTAVLPPGMTPEDIRNE
jgi:hypothetical protein